MRNGLCAAHSNITTERIRFSHADTLTAAATTTKDSPTRNGAHRMNNISIKSFEQINILLFRLTWQAVRAACAYRMAFVAFNRWLVSIKCHASWWWRARSLSDSNKLNCLVHIRLQREAPAANTTLDTRTTRRWIFHISSVSVAMGEQRAIHAQIHYFHNMIAMRTLATGQRPANWLALLWLSISGPFFSRSLVPQETPYFISCFCSNGMRALVVRVHWDPIPRAAKWRQRSAHFTRSEHTVCINLILITFQTANIITREAQAIVYAEKRCQQKCPFHLKRHVLFQYLWRLTNERESYRAFSLPSDYPLSEYRWAATHWFSVGPQPH